MTHSIFNDLLSTESQDHGLAEGEKAAAALADEQLGNPDKLVVETDEDLGELDKTLKGMAEDANGEIETQQAAEKVVKVVESMESRVAELTQLADSGKNLDATAFRFYMSGISHEMESRELSIVMADEVASMEAAMGVDAYDYTTEAKEAAEGIGSKAVNMFKSAIKRFLKFLKAQAARLVAMFGSIDKLGQKLIVASEKMSGVPEGTIENKKFANLVVGSKIDPIALLKGLEQALAKVDANDEKMASYLVETAKKAGGIAGGTGGLEVADKVDIVSALELELNESGNYAIKDERKVGEKVGTEPLGKAEVKSLGNDLVGIGHDIKLLEGKMETRAKELEAVVTAELQMKGSEGDVSKGMAEVNKSMKALNSGMSALLQFTGKAAKDAYRFGMASVNSHEKAAAPKKAEGEDK